MSRGYDARHLVTLARYRAEIDATRVMTRDEEVAYARAGDTDSLVVGMLRYALAVALRFAQGRADLDDIVQQANLGLIRAAQTFDPDKGRFCTYADWWMRNLIQEYMSRVPIVRLSMEIGDRARSVYRAHAPTTPEELASLARISQAVADDCWPLLTTRPVSLSAPTSRYGRTEPVSETVAGDSEPMRDVMLKNRIDEALTLLNTRQRIVFEARYMGDEPETLQSIADRLGVTRQRVEQIEKAAVTIMRGRLAREYREAA